MLPTFCVTVSQNFSQIDISVIEINSVLGIGVSLSIYIDIYIYTDIYIDIILNIYIYIYYIYIKTLLTNFLWFLNFGQVGELPRGFSKPKYYGDFFQKWSQLQFSPYGLLVG